MVGRVGVVVLAICPLGCFIPSGLEFDDFTATELPWDSITDQITVTTTLGSETVTATDSATSTTTGHPHTGDTSSSDGTDTDTDTDTGPESVCDPQPEDVESGVLFDGTPSWEHPHTELDVSCIVTWAGHFGPALHLGLACDDGAHTLDVTDIGELDVVAGDIVELSVFIDAPFWANVYVALRKDGALVLAALAADALPGDDDDFHPPADFYAPLEVIELDGVCPSEPEDPEPCHFICQGCTRDRRVALAFIVDDNAEVVYDRGSGQLGNLAIVVGNAREHVEVFCTDTPGARFDFVALRE